MPTIDKLPPLRRRDLRASRSGALRRPSRRQVAVVVASFVGVALLAAVAPLVLHGDTAIGEPAVAARATPQLASSATSTTTSTTASTTASAATASGAATTAAPTVLDALAPAAAPTTAAAPALTVDEQLAARLVALTNAERTKAGLVALATSPCATAQAAARAAVLVAQGRFQHDPLGPVFAACGGSSVGENLALGYPTPEAMTAGWMASPGHRENILRAYTTIGIGCVTGSTGVLCSQVFLG